MSDFKDIWNADAGAEGLSDEQLMAYIEGRLPEAERHAIEARLADEGMESDALEGLQTLSAEEARMSKARLNAELQKALHKKRRQRRGLARQQWNVIAVVVLLLLLLMCFGMFWMMRRN